MVGLLICVPTFLLQPNTGGCGKDDFIRRRYQRVLLTDVHKELYIHYGIFVYSVLEADYEPVSMVVYIYFNPDHTTKPLMHHLPHWASKGEAITVIFASDKVTGTCHRQS